jgi:nicotinate-nucleotide adenylyltransferase
MAMARPLIGLLGGSFDPVHIGHLQLARDARAHLALDEVRFIPAGQPWQKGELTDAAQRAHMVELAIRDLPGAALDMHEIERAGPTYTIETLRELRRALGAQPALVLLMGADQFERIETWCDWQQLLDHCHIAVAARNGVLPQLEATLHAWHEARRADAGELAARAAGGIAAFDMIPVDASATQIRALCSARATPTRDAQLAALLPAAVLDYIRRHRLYGYVPA